MENSTEMNVNEEVSEVIDSGEQAQAVDEPTSHNSDFDIVDDDQAESVDQQPEPKVQSREDNRAAKAARIRAEREAKEKAEYEADKRIRESGAINPYTDKPFESLKEFEEYGKRVKEAELKERAESEGKTVEELQEEEEAKEALREKRQKESQAAELAEQAEAQQDFFMEDLNDFIGKYPDVSVVDLDNDDKFRRFCGSRYGREPLADLYEDYKAVTHVPEKDTRSERSTGSGNSGGAILSTAQRKALDEWNRQNPDMAMTPKEYLSRG